MVDQNIINYLSEGLQEGHDIESLRKMLLEAGHDGSQVNQAIEIVNRAPKVNLGSSGKKSGSKRIIFLVDHYSELRIDYDDIVAQVTIGNVAKAYRDLFRVD